MQLVRPIAVIMVLLAFLVAACAASFTEDTPRQDQGGEKETVTTSTDVVGEDADLGPVAVAVADLADRLGVDVSVIKLISFEEVTWRDGSLGCPQPGMMYTQALVNGSLIVFRVDGSSYEYHSRAGGDPFFCATPTPPVEGGYGDV